MPINTDKQINLKFLLAIKIKGAAQQDGQIFACANDFLGLGIRSTSLSSVQFPQHVLDFFNIAKNVRGAHAAIISFSVGIRLFWVNVIFRTIVIYA